MGNHVESAALSIEAYDRKLGTGLCAMCAHSTSYHSRKRGLRVFCGYIRKFVPPDITECSRHANMGTMDINEMESIASKVDVRVGVNAKSYV